MMLKIRDKVEKVSGYKYPGIVVARFNKINSTEIRLVVECTEPTVSGMLHIFREDQLKKVEEEVITPTRRWWWPWGKETCYDT